MIYQSRTLNVLAHEVRRELRRRLLWKQPHDAPSEVKKSKRSQKRVSENQEKRWPEAQHCYWGVRTLLDSAAWSIFPKISCPALDVSQIRTLKRIYNLIKMVPIINVADLIRYTEQQLKDYNRVGPATVGVISMYVGRQSLSLGTKLESLNVGVTTEQLLESVDLWKKRQVLDVLNDRNPTASEINSLLSKKLENHEIYFFNQLTMWSREELIAELGLSVADVAYLESILAPKYFLRPH